MTGSRVKVFGVTLAGVVFVIVEKLVRIAIFLGYIVLLSRLKDLRRVFEYHGAEHKTINAYEAGAPLTVERVRDFTLIHPRCGTSFLLVVLLIAVAAIGARNHVASPSGPHTALIELRGEIWRAHRPHPGKEAKKYQVEEARELLNRLRIEA